MKKINPKLSNIKIWDPVISAFKSRIYAEDNDVFLIIAGPRGSCKSGNGISLGYRIDSTKFGYTRFYLDDKYLPKGFKLKPGEAMPRVIYKPSQLMDMLKNNEKYPMGTCIIWDEVGVEGDARDFAKKKNKLLKRTFQTIRSLNWFIILTSVTVRDFDIAFERNAGFYMKTINKTTLQKKTRRDKLLKLPYGKTKIYKLSVSPTTGIRYYNFFRYIEDGIQKKLSDYYYVRKPPSFMENPYKRYKHLFQNKLYTQYAEDLDDIASYDLGKDTLVEIDVINEKIEEVLADPEKYYDYKKKRFILAAIQYEGEIKIPTEARARKIIQLLNFKIRRNEVSIHV